MGNDQYDRERRRHGERRAQGRRPDPEQYDEQQDVPARQAQRRALTGTHWEPGRPAPGSQGYGERGASFGGPGGGYGPSGYSGFGGPTYARREVFHGSHWEPGSSKAEGYGGYGFGGPGGGYGPSGYSGYSGFAGATALLEPGPYTGRGPKGYQRSDERIREEICERLWLHGQVDASSIEVEVQGGEVTLSGSVDSRGMKYMAEDATDTVRGISEVHNHLRVRRAEQRSAPPPEQRRGGG